MRIGIMALSTAATLGLTTGPAFAQTEMTPPAATTSPKPNAPDAERSGDGDIIVTATRQETLLQNTPVAITALSAKTLEQRGVRSLLDVANYVPNLSIGGRGGLATAQGGVNLRGMGSDAPDSSPSVGIYIDEVYYPSQTGNLLGLFDVARIEVLRGPQGTLFGRNTIAGAIQYVSVKPTVDQFSGFAFGSLGTLDSYEASGAVNVPLGSTLAVRVSGQIQQQGGYVRDQLNQTDNGRTRNEQGRVQLRWQPSDRLTIDLKGETTKVESNGRPIVNTAFNPQRAQLYLIATGIIPVLPPFLTETRPFQPGYISPNGGRATAGFNAPDFFRLRYNAGSGIIAFDITDDIQVKSISAYSFTRSRIDVDFDASPLAILATTSGEVRTKLFTQELQLTGKSFGGSLNWTAGGYFYDSRQKITGMAQQLALAPLPPSPENTLRTRSYAAYGQATLDITGGLSATGGVRYSSETVRGEYTGNLFPQSRRRFTNTSPYAGLNWQVDDDKLLYAKASRGFRAGGFHLDPLLPGGSLFYGPETAWTYEAGARLQFLDRRLRINPTVFRTDWDNIQFVNIIIPPPPAGGVVAATRNAGDARLKGVEVESQFALTPAFQLTGSFSYLDANYRRLAPPAPGTIPVQLALSDSLARAPKFKYSFGGRYTLNLPNDAQIVASADYAWTDRQRSSVDGDQAVTLPSYGLLNARIEVSPPGRNLTFAFYATNLTNKYYLLDAIDLQSNTGFRNTTVGRPREFFASARITF